MAKLRIAIVRGGPSSQYDASLQTGAAFLKHIPDSFQAYDIFITKDGIWHREGAPRQPERALAGIDVIINALHGEFGEDGKIQKIFDHLNIPYTGSNALGSSLGMNKSLTKKVLSEQGIKTPYYAVVKKDDNLRERFDHIYNHFYLPFIVKPSTGGGAAGITMVNDFRQLSDALQFAFNFSDTALIEEFVRGREATCGVIEQFRNQPLYTLFPTEIAQPIHHIPGNFSSVEKLAIQEAAKKVHSALGLRHYSQSDFIVTPRRGIYVLEVNSQPALHEAAPMSKSIEAVGSSLPEFIAHIIALAQNQ